MCVYMYKRVRVWLQGSVCAPLLVLHVFVTTVKVLNSMWFLLCGLKG